MSKIPLDPNGVQTGYKVLHHHINDTLSLATPIVEIWRKCGYQEINITYWEEPSCVSEDEGCITIAVFRIKQTSSPLSVRLAHHAANGREIHLINKPYA